MAEEENKQDQSQHDSTEAARESARQKMQEAIKAKKEGRDIEVDTAGLEADIDDAQISGSSDSAKKKEKPELKDSDLALVKVYSPFRVYYDGPADSVSAENLTGPFDILPGHKNFMSLLTACEIVVRSKTGEERIKTDRGVMHVRQNKVSIFLDV